MPKKKPGPKSVKISSYSYIRNGEKVTVTGYKRSKPKKNR